MAMAQKKGNCPRLGREISFEMQYTEKDGRIEYVDCSCSEMICCTEYDEVQCPKIWIDFFNSVFGTNVSLQDDMFVQGAAGDDSGEAQAYEEVDQAGAYQEEYQAGADQEYGEYQQEYQEYQGQEGYEEYAPGEYPSPEAAGEEGGSPPQEAEDDGSAADS